MTWLAEHSDELEDDDVELPLDVGVLSGGLSKAMRLLTGSRYPGGWILPRTLIKSLSLKRSSIWIT